MRIRVFQIILFFTSIIANGQIVNIPDPVFKWGLVNLSVADLDGNGTFESDVDTNDDGEIQESEAEAVIGLNVAAYTMGGNHIQSIVGIEAFLNLETLNCAQQEISSIDVTTLGELKRLECQSNLLPSLDITSNLQLEYLTCQDNPIIGSVVTSNCPSLYYFVCGGSSSQIDGIDITQNPLLEIFSCRVVDLETINFTQNTLLNDLTISGASITSIDLSNNLMLEHLGIGETSIQSLDLQENTQLINLICEYNNLLEGINISNNLGLVNLFCRFNNLSILDVSLNTELM